VNALGAYRGLFSNGPLVRLLFGEFVSSIGDWLYLVALLIAVYRDTADPVLLGIVGAVRVLPYVFLSVPAGIVADRFDRRLILLVTDIARGLIQLALAAVVLLDGPLLAVVALAIFATCFSTFFGPTIGAYLPSLTRSEDELGPANSAWATLDNLAFVIGPAVAGLLIAASGLAPAFLLNALSFGVVAVVLLGLPSKRSEPTADAPTETPTIDAETGADARPSAEAELLATARPTAETTATVELRPVVGLALIDVISGFIFGGLGVLTVLLATDRLGGGEATTGYLNAAIGVGGIIGAIVAGALVLRPVLGPPLMLGAALIAIGLAGLGASDLVIVALVTIAIASIGSLVTEVISTTIFQRVVPDAVRGRVAGVTMTVGTLAYSLGGLTMPILSVALGPFVVLAGGGVAVVVAVAVALVLIGPAARRAPDAATLLMRRVGALPLFAGVPLSALETAAGRATPVSVPAGTVVVREGDPAMRFYVIESGSFSVDQLDPASGTSTRLRTMGPDEVFGELGLLQAAPRSATVTAETDGRLLALDGPDFLQLVGSAGPGLSARLLDPSRFGLTPAAPEREVETQVSAT
jgi:MFS family permease